MKLFGIASPLALAALFISFLVPEAPANGVATHRNIVIGMRGTAIGEMRRVATPSGPVEALCFEIDIDE